MRDILKLGESLERLIGCVYEELAANFEPDSHERALLEGVASEEFVHARVISALIVEVEEVGTGVHFDYRRVRDEQLRILGLVTSLLCEVRGEGANLGRILEEMLEMEKSLSENLFGFLSLLTSIPSRDKVQQLAKQSEEHAVRLAGISFPS